MQLLKVRNGLLEIDNFYMTSSFADFLGVGTTHRDANSFYIDGNEKIEREFPYKTFVIELNKENWTDMSDDDSLIFYVSDAIDEYGIIDSKSDDPSSYQKILFLDNHVQCYISNTGKEWINVGGADLLGTVISKQGFRKSGSKSQKIMNYAVYIDPYLTIQNFPENYKIELHSEGNTKIKERLFTSEQVAQIYLDYCMKGYIKVYDTNNTLVYTSRMLDFNYGDVYTANEFEIEISYESRTLPDEETTELTSYGYPQKVILKNISSNKTYTNLKISTEIDSTDIIELSFDAFTYDKTIVLSELSPNQEQEIYISIKRGSDTRTFEVRDFLFKIEE